MGRSPTRAIHLRPEGVVESLLVTGGDAPSHEVVVDALTQLEEWGNLRADPDTNRVTTVEDFHRARYLYQMTRKGAAAEAALSAYDEALGRRGALQRVALLQPLMPRLPFVNAHAIAKARWPSEPEARSYDAARVAEATRDA